jgi:chorismate-pyruvate lyase
VSAAAPGPNVPELYRLFGDRPPPRFTPIAADALPEPYRRLLDHPHHMTVTVEDHYGGPVSVRVLKRSRAGDTYSRMILLETADGRVVQFGIVRIHLDLCSEAVRDAILAESMPLGHVLIAHDVLRRIEPTAFLRVEPDEAMRGWFGRSVPTYGRLGIIHCDDRPAIDLLEILAPIPT